LIRSCRRCSAPERVTIGLDLASLVVVAPITVAVAVLALRRHPAAPLLALGRLPSSST
jgi:hypothetical protein